MSPRLLLETQEVISKITSATLFLYLVTKDLNLGNRSFWKKNGDYIAAVQKCGLLRAERHNRPPTQARGAAFLNKRVWPTCI